MSTIRWLGLKREKELFEYCLEHSRKSREAAKSLGVAISDLCEGKYDELEKIAEQIIQMSKEADSIATSLRFRIGKSNLDSTSRHDMLDLIFHLGRVTNGIEASAYRMEMSQGLEVPAELKDQLKELVEGVVKTSDVLGESLDKVAYDWGSALKKAEEVRTWEEKVDDVRRKAMRHLVSISDELGISTFWRLSEIIKHLEDTADSAEETANILTLIIATRRY